LDSVALGRLKKKKKEKGKKRRRKMGGSFGTFAPILALPRIAPPLAPNPTYTPNAKAKGKNVMPKGRAQD